MVRAGRVEKRVIRLLAEKGGAYPNMISLIKDYVSRYGYGFYTRRWIRVFVRRLYRMQEKGLIKIISEPGKQGKAIILQPLGWAILIKVLKEGGRDEGEGK